MTPTQQREKLIARLTELHTILYGAEACCSPDITDGDLADWVEDLIDMARASEDALTAIGDLIRELY